MIVLKPYNKHTKIAEIIVNHEKHDLPLFTKKTLQNLAKILDLIIIKNKEYLGVLIYNPIGSDFCYGFDPSEILKTNSCSQATELSLYTQNIFSKLSSLNIPSVVAIYGKCFGIGFELAIHCKYRVSSFDNTKLFKATELENGFMPFGGGTHQLPQLIGIQNALDFYLHQKSLGSKEAFEKKLVHELYPDYLLVKASTELLLNSTKDELIKKRKKTFIKKISHFSFSNYHFHRKILYKKHKENIFLNFKDNTVAPFKLLKSVYVGFDKSTEEALFLERKFFSSIFSQKEIQILASQSLINKAIKNRVDIFYNKAKILKSKNKPLAILNFASIHFEFIHDLIEKGFFLYLYLKNQEHLEKRLKDLYHFFLTKTKNQKEKKHVKNKFFHLIPTTKLEEIYKNYLIFDMINSNYILVKKGDNKPFQNKDFFRVQVFRSSKQKYIEIRNSHQEESKSYDFSMILSFFHELDYNIQVLKTSQVFYGSILRLTLLSEYLTLITMDVTTEIIDNALKNRGFNESMKNLCPQVNIKTLSLVLKINSNSDPRSQRLERLLEEAQKLYQSNIIDFSDILSFICTKKQIPKKSPFSIEEETVSELCLLRVINCAIICLEQKIISDCLSGDYGALNSIGFPKHLGGPFRYINTLGLETYCKLLKKSLQSFGSRFTPPKFINKLDTCDKYILNDWKLTSKQLKINGENK